MTVAQLAKILGKECVPLSRVQELLYPAGDARLEDVKKKLAKSPEYSRRDYAQVNTAQQKVH